VKVVITAYVAGDVYLLGCTNVGKSTLFNALLRSDYCKVKAVDLIQRATTSPWPGTTINLLKVTAYCNIPPCFLAKLKVLQHLPGLCDMK
jgi:ribosome biogenesis GTPase A